MGIRDPWGCLEQQVQQVLLETMETRYITCVREPERMSGTLLKQVTSVCVDPQGEQGGPGQKGSKGDKGEAVSLELEKYINMYCTVLHNPSSFDQCLSFYVFFLHYLHRGPKALLELRGQLANQDLK